ncbi:ABC transporter ATP-binding protein [Polyangium sp. 6x1]|uniref:ABC transporter ATP-binding protein n=1 Tax=Polyangium sp. 6x1 TaxID=3042689 RepID=UPI0024828F3A|nr:ABC transporter ATP-binding protein [Polyangium sp. 6x1]MDI1444507.1 ABC transporter ATP-binding protein [Polyangium sp. 6x1]
MTAPEPLLSIRDLAVSFATAEGTRVQALDGVSFDVPQGKTVGLVGESGCGKTATALSILRLLPTPSARIDRGAIVFQGEDLLRLPERAMRQVRGGKIGMVFQEPLTALTPVYSVGAQIMEAIRLHERMSLKEAKDRARSLLHRVGFPRPDERFDSYPHELSGGMRQRVLLAMALAAPPRLLVADEPTSALDMALRAQIMALLADQARELGMSLLVITHDLPFVAEIAHEIVVLYAGKVVETGPPSRVLGSPRHPYTKALVRSVPPANSFRTRGEKRKALPTIEGSLPDPRGVSRGCAFAPRCPEGMDRCREEAPPLVTTAGARDAVRCFLHQGGAA